MSEMTTVPVARRRDLFGAQPDMIGVLQEVLIRG